MADLRQVTFPGTPRKRFPPPMWVLLSIGLLLVATPFVLASRQTAARWEQEKTAPCEFFATYRTEQVPARCIRYFHSERDAGK